MDKKDMQHLMNAMTNCLRSILKYGLDDRSRALAEACIKEVEMRRAA